MSSQGINGFKLNLSKEMAKVINRKIRFLRWLNTGLILPLSAFAIISTLLLYLVLMIAI